MKPAPFELHIPKTIPEAITILSTHDNVRPLAGGQSLIPMLNFRLLCPDHLVDLNRITELSHIRRRQGGVSIGAMTRQRHIEVSEAVLGAAPILREGLSHVGHRQTRNRGTIGGSLAHLDPSAELPAIALLYDAELRIAGPSGLRTLPIGSFMVDCMTSSLESDELLVEISFPDWRPGHGYAFLETARRMGDFAAASVGVLLEKDFDEISRAAIVIGGVDVLPKRLHKGEAMLIGNQASDPLFAAVAAEALLLESPGDIHFSPDHRRHIAATLTARALKMADERVSTRPLTR